MTVHPSTRFVTFAIVGFVLAFGVAGGASAQSELMFLLDERLQPFEHLGNLSVTHYGSEDVSGRRNRGEKLGRTDYSHSVLQRLDLKSDTDMFVGGRFKAIDLHGRPKLRDHRGKLPSNFFDVGLGFGFKTPLDNDWNIGGTLFTGSASDEPFNSVRELYVDSTAFLEIPRSEDTSLLFMLNVNTKRDYPVAPGFAYKFMPTERMVALVGLPFLGIAGNITDQFSVEAWYAIPEYVHLGAGYRPVEWLRMSIAADWTHDYFWRTNRRQDSDLFEFEDKRVSAKAEFWITDGMSIAARGGYAFDRKLGEGHDSSERSETELKVDDTWFVGLDLNVRF